MGLSNGLVFRCYLDPSQRSLLHGNGSGEIPTDVLSIRRDRQGSFSGQNCNRRRLAPLASADAFQKSVSNVLSQRLPGIKRAGNSRLCGVGLTSLQFVKPRVCHGHGAEKAGQTKFVSSSCTLGSHL